MKGNLMSACTTSFRCSSDACPSHTKRSPATTATRLAAWLKGVVLAQVNRPRVRVIPFTGPRSLEGKPGERRIIMNHSVIIFPPKEQEK